MALNDSTYARANNILAGAWSAANKPDETEIPDAVRLAIAKVMSSESQIAQLYALPTQLLIQATTDTDDTRALKDLPGDDRPFTARPFAKNTIVKHPEVGPRLGASDDPYVSNPLRKDRLSDDLLVGHAGQIWDQLFDVLDYADNHPDQATQLLSLVLSHITSWIPTVPAPKTSPPPAPQKSNIASLDEATALTEDMLLDIIEVLESDQPQVVFTGPPGTSKTHTALAIAKYLAGEAHRVVQFHPSYGYEEFVEGLHAVSRDDGGFEFKLTPGLIRRLSDGIADDERYVLVVDELNRANLPRVFGELLFAIERRGEPIDLMYTEGFRLSPGLILIGTMNTADRSIRTLDSAIRRRFQFFEFAPSAAVLQTFYEERPNEVDDLITGFNSLNATMTALIDRHHTIGHTFLMDGRGMTSARIRQVWDRQIMPLLDDYLFDQPSELAAMNAARFWPSIEGA